MACYVISLMVPVGFFPVLAGDFEVYTIFVQKSEDLDSISEHWAQAVLQGLKHGGVVFSVAMSAGR